jgi:UrcA family protein
MVDALPRRRPYSGDGKREHGIMKRSLVAIGAIFFGAADAMAQAPVIVEGQANPSAVVTYADLNLGSDSGQNRLVQRIRAASEDLCLEDDVQDLATTLARRSCYNRAMSSGLAQMRGVIAGHGSKLPFATAALVIRAH